MPMPLHVLQDKDDRLMSFCWLYAMGPFGARTAKDVAASYSFPPQPWRTMCLTDWQDRLASPPGFTPAAEQGKISFCTMPQAMPMQQPGEAAHGLLGAAEKHPRQMMGKGTTCVCCLSDTRGPPHCCLGPPGLDERQQIRRRSLW